MHMAYDILTPHERVITLVYLYRQRLVGDVPFHLKFALKVTHPPLKNADFYQYLQLHWFWYFLSSPTCMNVLCLYDILYIFMTHQLLS